MARYENEILTLVNCSNEHLTAYDVYEKMKKEGSKVSLASVYNNLNKLTEKKLIQKIVVEGEIDRFDKVEKHDHLICQNCGALVDIKFSDLTKTLNKQMDSNLISYDLKVYYLCPKCQKKLRYTK